MAEFKLPDVGEGLTEAEIVSWKVKEGDTVTINQVIVEIETAKSLVELPSPFEGTVQSLMVPEGETVPVGTPIIAIGDEASPSVEAAETAPPSVEPAEIDLSNPAASGGGEGESLVGRNKADRTAVRRARHAAPLSAGAEATHQQVQGSFQPGLAPPELPDVPDEPAVPATAAPLSPAATRTLAKPPVRKLAKDLGVDLASLVGSGPGRRGDACGRRVGSLVGRRRLRESAGLVRLDRRGTRDPRAGQGRAQDDEPGDGRLGVLDPPRHRVGDPRRHPHRGAGRAAQGPP